MSALCVLQLKLCFPEGQNRVDLIGKDFSTRLWVIIIIICALNSAEGENSATFWLLLESSCSRILCSRQRCSTKLNSSTDPPSLGAQNCCRRSPPMDQGSGGDEEVGSDFVQVWHCHLRKGLEFPEVAGSFPGQGKVLGLVCIL